MIKFFVEIEEQADGGVRFDVETPASSNATPAEISIGLKVKDALDAVELGGLNLTVKPWGDVSRQ